MKLKLKKHQGKKKKREKKKRGKKKIESKKKFGERCLSMSSPIMEQRMIADTHDKADIM